MGVAISRRGLRVVGFQDQGQGGIVEAEIPELLLGIQQAGSGLVHRDPGRDQRFAAQNLFVTQMFGPQVAILVELKGGIGREILRLRRTHLGRIDDGDDVTGFDLLPEVHPGFAEEAGDTREDFGVTVGVIGCLRIGNQLVGVLDFGCRSRLKADIAAKVRRSKAAPGGVAGKTSAFRPVPEDRRWRHKSRR